MNKIYLSTDEVFDRNLVCKINFWNYKYITSPPAVEISLFVFLKPKHKIFKIKLQSTYTIKLEFCTLYDEKDLKRKMFLRNNIFFYDKLYILLLFTKVWTIKSTVTSKATVYIYKINKFNN